MAGRLTGVENGTVTFDDSAPANVAAGDVLTARITAILDPIIGPPDPGLPEEPDEAADPIELDPPRRLDLRAANIGTIVWCTGYSGDFTWLPTDLVTAAAKSGVWYIGLRWLTHRAAGNFLGFPTDARTVADAIATHLHANRTSVVKPRRKE